MFGKPNGAVQQVLTLRQQGKTDNQVVQDLQKQGMSTQQIFDALSQADLSDAHEPEMQWPEHDQLSEMAPPPQFAQQAPQQFAQQQPMQPQASQHAPQFSQFAPQQSQQQSHSDERIEEVAEAIINEKWDEMLKEVQKIITWKEHVESENITLREQLSALKDEFNQLRQGLFGKISEADDRMRDVSSSLSAVQKVFKDVIPEFTANVAELGRLTGRVKPVRQAEEAHEPREQHEAQKKVAKRHS